VKTYKLEVLDNNKKKVGEYGGKEIITEEIVKDLLIIRLPFTPMSEELDDEKSLFNVQLKEFIQKLVQLRKNDVFGDKGIFIVPKDVEFMKLVEEKESE
jgi:hypothetical protein